MTLPSNIKVTVLPRFPAQVIGRTAITVNKTNGIYNFDIDYSKMTPVASLPADPLYTLVWDYLTNHYILAPLSVFAYVEAPNDTNTYGRHALAWTPVLPIAGGNLTGPLVLQADPAVALGAATKQYVDNKVSTLGTPGVIPENSQSANYTLVATDAGGFIFHPITDNNARTFTIPANSSVAYAVGTVISFVNLINTVTIAITTDTMYLAGPGTTGSRTLAAYGCCTALKVTSTSWIISGTGLT